MNKELEDELLKREKSFIEKIGGGTIVTLIGLTVSLISTFAVSQYKISEIQLRLDKRDGDSKTLIVVEQEVKDLTKSLDELKVQNKETYRLLLDVSRHQ